MDAILKLMYVLLAHVDVSLGVVGLLVKEHRNGKQGNGGECQENGCHVWEFGFQCVP